MEKNLSFPSAERADCKVLHMKLHERVVVALERKECIRKEGDTPENQGLY